MKFATFFSNISHSAIRESFQYKTNIGFIKCLMIQVDMIYCALRYKCSPSNYFYYSFYARTPIQRRQVLTDRERNLLLKKYEDDYSIGEEDKYRNYCQIKQYYRRECVLLSSAIPMNCELSNFIARNRYFFAKPFPSSCGQGILKIDIHDYSSPDNLISALLAVNPNWILEEPINQGKEMSAWNGSSINTVRINSFNTKIGFYLMGNFFRTGRNGSIVDNAGGAEYWP